MGSKADWLFCGGHTLFSFSSYRFKKKKILKEEKKNYIEVNRINHLFFHRQIMPDLPAFFL